MNCDLCQQHILATMQIAWNGGNFHPDCIGEAVARKRAAEERQINADERGDLHLMEEIEETAEAENFPDDDFDEYADYEETDDLDDLIDRLDDETVFSASEISDDVFEQIPVSVSQTNGGRQGNGKQSNGNRFETVPDSSLQGSVATVSPSQTALPKSNGGNAGTLIAGVTTALTSRDSLKELPLPEETATFKPIPHYELVESILRSLSFRRLSVIKEEYAISQDGMKLFGLVELDVEYAGVRFAVGLRNANDKSMRVGLVAGYRVIVCENKMLTGDFAPLLAKHSKNFQLLDALSVAVDRIQRSIGEVSDQIERKKVTMLSADAARSLIYQSFLEQKFPISLLRAVHKEYFLKPSFEEFRGNNLWTLENAFTTTFKRLKPVQQFEAAARLGAFLAPHVSPF